VPPDAGVELTGSRRRSRIEQPHHPGLGPNLIEDVHEQQLIGLINRMRLFASTEVISGAEAVLKAIVGILLKPRVELRQLAMDAVSKGLTSDPLLPFSSICRIDLDKVRTARI